MKQIAKNAAPFKALWTYAGRGVSALTTLRRSRSAGVAATEILPWALLCAALLLASAGVAEAARNPFAVGANEGAAGDFTGWNGWILGMETGFSHMLSGAIRATKQSGAAAWGLAGISLAYGVVHAAGPGHGKAVISSYLLANETMLRRGLVISLAAALLQGFVAVTIVGVAALVLGATAKHMTAAANLVEIAGYAGVVVLGGTLVYAKGAAFLAAWRAARTAAAEFAFTGFLTAHAGGGFSTRFSVDDCRADHTHGPSCGHFHAADPRALATDFAWKAAFLTVLTAGSRPCSGAILVLVFAAAQGIFLAGIGAVVAMSLGTAATTGALAAMAVLAKKTAAKYSKASSSRAIVLGRLFELAAAFAVLTFGLALLAATLSGAAPPAS